MNYSITGQKVIEVLKNDQIFVSVDPDFSNRVFKDFSFNSRQTGSDGLFLCKGQRFKEAYLNDASEHGAVGYISEQKYESPLPGIITSDINRAMGLIAAAFYDYPQNAFNLVGVTGTKGKSTTVYFLVNVLDEIFKQKPAFLSSIDYYDGTAIEDSHLTTPESLDTYSYFARAKENGIKNFVMECSSQADKMQRLTGIRFNYGVFTNISNDHISPKEHHSFEELLQCKMNIVRRYDHAVINLDDGHSQDALNAAAHAKKIITYSLHKDAKADIYAEDIQKDGYKTHFTAVTPKWKQPMTVNILGDFNVSNALAACSVAYLMGADPEDIAAGIEKTTVKGRMDIFEYKGRVVVADYAHNQASIYEACKALKETFPNKKLGILFGCPGGKAFERRKLIPQEAVKFCDLIYVTDEDPWYEDSMHICQEIADHVHAFSGECEIITDRKECIKTAVSQMTENDILLMVGKGAEQYMYIEGRIEPFEGDMPLAKMYLKEFLSNESSE